MPKIKFPLAKAFRWCASRGAFACAGFAVGALAFGADEAERALLWASGAYDLVFGEADAEPAAKAYTKNASGSSGFDPLGGIDSKDFASAASNAPAGTWTIPYWIDPKQAPMGESKAIELVKRAASAWEPCGARFSYQGIRSKSEYGTYGPDETPLMQPIIAWMPLHHEQAGITWTTTAKEDGEGSDAASESEAIAAQEPQVARWTIELDPESTKKPTSLIATATHEFGHALGLAHSRDKKSIMFGDDNPALKPSASDLSECRRILSAWKAPIAAQYKMAFPSAPAKAQSSDSTMPTRRSKSPGSALQAGMNTQASK